MDVFVITTVQINNLKDRSKFVRINNNKLNYSKDLQYIENILLHFFLHKNRKHTLNFRIQRK